MGLTDAFSESLSTLWVFVKASANAETLAAYNNLQMLSGDLISQNRELRAEVALTQESLRFQEGLVFRHNCYWMGPEDTQENGPYCSSCWDAKRLGVRLHLRGDHAAICPNCDVSVISLPEGISPTRPHPSGPVPL
jgi:hypothetical protein